MLYYLGKTKCEANSPNLLLCHVLIMNLISERNEKSYYSKDPF